MPVLDAATLRMTERRGTDFGFVRAWGTVGYTVTTAMTGDCHRLARRRRLRAAVRRLWSLLRAALACSCRASARPEQVAAPARPAGVKTARGCCKPWFLLPCIAFALIQSTHFFLGALGALVWKSEGIGEGWIGPLIAVSAVGRGDHDVLLAAHRRAHVGAARC